jgi:hypothetical protein
MSRTLGRMAPTAIVFALAVWCCWPYLDELRSSLEVEQGGDLPRITSSLLSPTVEPVPKRDPFQPPPAIRADPPGSKKPEIKKLAASSPHPQAGPRQAGASDQANAQRPGTDVVKTLVLEAIYIQGDRRVALINDRVYAQGEPLAISDPAAEPYIVAQISPDKVLLLHRGQTVELPYAGGDPRAHARPARSPTKAAMPTNDPRRHTRPAVKQRHE